MKTNSIMVKVQTLTLLTAGCTLQKAFLAICQMRFQVDIVKALNDFPNQDSLFNPKAFQDKFQYQGQAVLDPRSTSKG